MNPFATVGSLNALTSESRGFSGFCLPRWTESTILKLTKCEKYLQHQQDLYHVFIDFKKAFDRVWHAALWATMKKYNISKNLIQVIKNLYNKATSAILFNGSIGAFPTVISTLTHPLQHISGKYHDRWLRRSWRHCQYWRHEGPTSPKPLGHRATRQFMRNLTYMYFLPQGSL